MEARVVTVAGATGGGNQDITFAGGTSFTPKAAILQWSRHAVSDNTFTDGFSVGYGFTDGTNSRCVACVSEDAVASSDTARIQQNDALIVALNPSGTITTVDALATFVSWLTDGMRINWSNAPGAAMRITVTFLGGNDLTNVTVGTVVATTGASCSVSGLAYQPEWGMFLCTGTTTENSASSTAPVCISLGAVDSSESQWCQIWAHADAAGSNYGRSYCAHTRCVITGDNAGVTGYSVFGNWDATGFTLTNTDTYAASYPIYYLIGKGGEVKVGNATEPGSTGQQTITTNTDVKGVIILGVDVNIASMATPGSWISGMGDSTLEDECLSAAEVSASDPTANVSRHDTDAIYVNITANATASSSTIDDEASLYAVSSTGFTLDWSNIGQGFPFRYITFGGAAGPQNFPVTISEPSISIDAGSLTRIQTRRFTISDPTISAVDQTLVGKYISRRTISDTPTVTIGAETISSTIGRVRTISDTPSITIDQTISGIFKAVREITDTPSITAIDSIIAEPLFLRTISNETAVVVSAGTLQRLFNSYRTISETPSITAIDSLARIASLHVAITEPQISISELLAGQLTFLKTISESTISANDTIARILTAIRIITITEEPSNTISDLVTRLQTLIRQISEDAISVNDTSLQAGLLTIVSLVESRVKWYYSLLTRKILEGEG